MAHTAQEQRSKHERIARLRTRLKEAHTIEALRAVMLGILDLLDDEL